MLHAFLRDAVSRAGRKGKWVARHLGSIRAVCISVRQHSMLRKRSLSLQPIYNLSPLLWRTLEHKNALFYENC